MSDSSEMQVFICGKCNKKFKNQYTLKTHMDTSKSCGKDECKEKYKCNNCTYKTGLKNSLQDHIKICKICKFHEEDEIDIEELMEHNRQLLRHNNQLMIQLLEMNKQLEDWRSRCNDLDRKVIQLEKDIAFRDGVFSQHSDFP
jgi:uncharacterized Zn-finger protein